MAVDDASSVLLAGLVLVLTYLLGTTALRRYRFVRKVDKIPGPPAYPLVGNALDVLVPRNHLMKIINARANKYAPIYRTWTGPYAEVHITSPDYIEIVLSGMKHIEKGTIYKFLHPWLGEGLLTSKGSKWQLHRKMITPTFHFKILETFFTVFVEKGQVLIKKLNEEIEKNLAKKEIDLYPFISRCTLDIICETAMGVQLHAQEETESEYVKAVMDISELILQRSIRPWLHKKFLFNMTKRGQKFSKCLQTLHGFTEKVIQERKQEALKGSKKEMEVSEDDIIGRKKRLAFLDLLLENMIESNALNDKELREEVDTFMFEGHDTTTVGISWALILLGNHPHIQEKVFEELDYIFQGSDRPITMRDVQEMKYLERVIKETLRLYPSVPFIMRNVEQDTQFGQYTIPKGSMVNVHIYHVHRDPKHYPNPMEFNPDNFLPERVQGRHPYAYIPFSAGPRNCIGQKFALLEEKTLLATILRNFKVKSLEKVEDIVQLNELVLRPESGVLTFLTPR